MDGQQTGSQNEPSWQFKPGETISPRKQDTDTASASAPTPTAVPGASPAQAPASPPPAAESPAPVTADTPAPAPIAVPPAPTNPDSLVKWTASEFISHQKGGGWHILLVAGSLALAAAVWFLTKDIVSPVVIVIAGITLSVYGSRQPNQVDYTLSDQGVSIGSRQYHFGEFKAFSVLPEGAFDSIVLTPAKRFAPLTTLFYDPDDEDRILEIITRHLPYKERGHDMVDGLMRRIRF